MRALNMMHVRGAPKNRTLCTDGQGCECRFASNIGILLLNKHLLGGYGFRFPVMLTLCHMVACVILSQASLSHHQWQELCRGNVGFTAGSP